MKRIDDDPRRQLHDDSAFVQWSRRIKASDQRAYAELFEAMHANLIRYAFRYTGQSEAARDIVQDAFLKVWQARESLDPSRSLRGLLYTIVRNLSLNFKRSAQRAKDPLPPSDIEDGLPAADQHLDGSILETNLRKFIDELPPRRKQAFVLSRFHGMSHKEIAAEMQLTSRTVNTHIVHALRYLRARIAALQDIKAHEE